MPRVSVVIPTFNRASLLPTAVSTVLNQTWKDLELIIVDDGSQDETVAICSHLIQSDARIRYVEQENRGPNAARNTGVRIAKGEWIAFLDSDDEWELTKLEKQVAIMESKPDVGLVYCDWAYLSHGGQTWPGVNPPELQLPTDYESLLYNNIVHGSASAVLIRAECFERSGLFDESLRYMEDWEMWLRIARHYRFDKVPEVLVHLLQHPEQGQRMSKNMADGQLQLLAKINESIVPQYRNHLPKVRWHHQILAAEQYLKTSRLRCWRALADAIQAWPASLASPRTWYIFFLSLTGPLYPYASAVGQVMRKWCRQYLKLDSVTGWR